MKARGFEEFHPVPGTPLAYSSKYTLLAYKVNWERLTGKELQRGKKMERERWSGNLLVAPLLNVSLSASKADCEPR